MLNMLPAAVKDFCGNNLTKTTTKVTSKENQHHQKITQLQHQK